MQVLCPNRFFRKSYYFRRNSTELSEGSEFLCRVLCWHFRN